MKKILLVMAALAIFSGLAGCKHHHKKGHGHKNFIAFYYDVMYR